MFLSKPSNTIELSCSVQTMKIDNVMYFEGRYIAAALGYAHPLRAIHQHVDEEDVKRLEDLEYSKGGNKLVPPLNDNDMKTSSINESGMYSLILRSNKSVLNISRGGSQLRCFHH